MHDRYEVKEKKLWVISFRRISEDTLLLVYSPPVVATA
jgi:hypothetical protein